MKNHDETGIREFRSALRHLERFVTGTLKDNSECCGVTPNQCHVLLKVEESGEASLAELKEYLGLDKSVISRTVDGLVRLSLLKRREDTEDRRYQVVQLTKSGMEFVSRINNECDTYYLPMYMALPEALKGRIIEDFKALTDAFHRTLRTRQNHECCFEMNKPDVSGEDLDE